MNRREFIDRLRDLDPEITRALETLDDAAFEAIADSNMNVDSIARAVLIETAPLPSPVNAAVRRIEHWATNPTTDLKFVFALMTDGTYRVFEDLASDEFQALCDEELEYELANGF